MQVQVARIGKPHGIRGEVTVQVLTDAPEERFVLDAEFVVEPARLGPLTLRSARWNKEILRLGFHEVPDRNRAEELRGARLFVNTEDAEDEGDAWYEHELVGLAVLVDGREVGRVSGLNTMPAQDLLVVEAAGGEEVLVPFVTAIVPEVDVEAGFVRLTPPAGLFELNSPDAAGEPDDGAGER
ncbi:ribosome maturation factor RimM [Arthrobacter deserti]|uniref:Ribosome maturation factor RimM n=1 Tax=Arthrobacter deserti TaxID=1742687 RepID=A0ABX1JUM1_9MICC|nr:ribosome maturation factor RimM [Arthrobacter deserti]